jgi:hypothetical protein
MRACSLSAEEFSEADELQNPLNLIFYKYKVYFCWRNARRMFLTNNSVSLLYVLVIYIFMIKHTWLWTDIQLFVLDINLYAETKQISV